jgi:FkbM family methyltransferase
MKIFTVSLNSKYPARREFRVMDKDYWLGFLPTCVFLLCLSSLPCGSSQQNKAATTTPSRPKALRVHYPYDFFSPNGKSWRSQQIHLSETLTQSSIDYTKLSLAQDHEDIWLYENWFYGMENGIIMESGALDGIRYSTTFFFETFLKWTSIHIGACFLFSFFSLPPHSSLTPLPSTEADPRNYFHLVHNREKSININAALCSETKLLHYTNDEGGQIQGFVEFMSQPFLRRWHPKIYKNITKLEDLMTVQCVQMSRLSTELHIPQVDVWILDVEGAELSVLQGTNFDDLFVKVVVMECDMTDLARDREKQEILEKNHFKCEQVSE